MHQNIKLAEERIRRTLNERIIPAIYSATSPVELAAWQVPDEPVPFSEASQQTFTPFHPGESWGRAWSTWWFTVTGTIPKEWAGKTVELVLDPGYQGDWPGNQAEALIYTPNGDAVKGLHPRNHHLRLAQHAEGGEAFQYFVEAAANPDILKNDFVPTPYGDKATAPREPIYTWRSAQIAVFEDDVWALRFDIEVLDQLMHELSLDDPRRHEILRALDSSLDVLAIDDIVGTAAAARAVLAPTLTAPANGSAHRLSAIGHAHIDSAWLWPIRETKRKTGRTFSNVLALAQDYPELKFAASSAQQYQWVKERHPDVFARIKQAIADGIWVPVGSQWIEPDGNLPGGEAMVRQLTQGLRYFQDEFEIATHGVWLPDSFGYSAAFPQVAKLAGLDWFLTQKISWNQTNTFPHHTFWWEGIDGSRIFTHFPPVDDYNSTLEGEQLHHAVRGFREKGKATTSLVPFGYGDGGGGPVREMLERQRRTRSLEGSPRVEIEHPDDFFARARQEYPDAPVWVGELYLELHRGTFTSHAREKRGNRIAERLLAEAELWSATATVRTGASYPYDELDRLWQATLLQQFHDILPGSSIAWVHQENEQDYLRNASELESLVCHALESLGGGVANVTSLDRTGLVVDHDGTPIGLVRVPGAGMAPADIIEPLRTVVADPARMSNGLVTVKFDDRGLITSIVDERAEREIVPAGAAANLLQLFEDVPNYWDAWDIDQHYRRNGRNLVELESIDLVESGPLRATVRVTRSFGRSRVVQDVMIVADDPAVHIETELDWHEDEKLLKAAFPLLLHAQHHSAEIQFGHLRRPLHTNTSWDDARFEVMAHRWVHVEEPGYGVAITNGGTYGHDFLRRVADTGEVVTEVRLSLVRAARSPDPGQDIGHHHFSYSIVPGASIQHAIDAGEIENAPLRLATDLLAPQSNRGPLISVISGSARISSVKLADDRSGDVIVRLYESDGGRTDATVMADFDVTSITEVDLLERPLDNRASKALSLNMLEGHVALSLRPFQIVTLRFAR